MVELTERLDLILSRYLKLSVSELEDDVSYDSLNSWDSLTHIQMVSAIEKEFDIEIDIEEMIALENVGKIRALVREKTDDESS